MRRPHRRTVGKAYKQSEPENATVFVRFEGQDWDPATGARHYLDALDHVVAALLPTTEPLTETEVARACPSASHVGVREALHRLAASGVVLRVPGGYIINREHLVFPALELLDGLHGRLRQRIRAALDAWGGEISCVGLFGSTARRDGDAQSDIDLLLVSDDPRADDFALELADDVERWTGNRCQVMALTEKDLRRMKRAQEPIVEVWIDELDPIVGSIDEALTTRRGSSA